MSNELEKLYARIIQRAIINLRELEFDVKPYVWGLITGQKDLESNSLSIDDFESIENGLEKGNMTFKGCGKSLVTAFRERIHHILETNGALFDGRENKGHAQKNQDISLNTIQPYPKGDLRGLYPTITIQP